MTPVVKATGSIARLSRNWYHDVTREGATTVVGYAWARVTGDAALDAQTSAGVGIVSGGTAGTVSTFTCTALLDNGARIVHTWQVLAKAGAASTVASPVVFFGVGAAGRVDLEGLTQVSALVLPYTFMVSPVAQKIYAAVPVSLGTPRLMMGAFVTPTMSSSVFRDGVTYTLLETVDLITWTDLEMTITEAP
jgi:integral membrane sensor domain MASE1